MRALSEPASQPDREIYVKVCDENFIAKKTLKYSLAAVVTRARGGRAAGDIMRHRRFGTRAVVNAWKDLFGSSVTARAERRRFMVLFSPDCVCVPC